MARIEQGEFGYCTERGERIGVTRLLVCPTVEYTIEIQELLENRARRFRIQGVKSMLASGKDRNPHYNPGNLLDTLQRMYNVPMTANWR